MAPRGLVGWPRPLAALLAAWALVVLLSTTTSAASDDDLSGLTGATCTLAQAGRARVVAARSDSDYGGQGVGKGRCGLGHYRRKSGVCMPCPRGTYSTTYLDNKCVECPKGTTTAASGSSRKSQCNGEGAAACLQNLRGQCTAKD
jgi:hypothetical protein